MNLTIKSVRLVPTHHPVPPCQATAYAPCYVFRRYPDQEEVRELLYTMGDPITRPSYPLLPYGGGISGDNPNRGADRIRQWQRRTGGVWEAAKGRGGMNIVVSNVLEFPWMLDAAYIAAHPWDHVGSTASPAVVERSGVLHMAHVASMNDPYVTTGAHTDKEGKPSRTGFMPADKSGVDPWAHFALYWRISVDGLSWPMRRFNRKHDHESFRQAAVFYAPEAEDIGMIDYGHQQPDGTFVYKGDNMHWSGYNGIGGCSLTYSAFDAWFYLNIGFWTRYGGPKQLLLRVREDDLWQFYVWNWAEWEPLEDGGRLPRWVCRERIGRGEITFRADQFRRAVHPFSRDGYWMFVGTNPESNAVEVKWNDNPVKGWAAERTVTLASAVRGFADGTAPFRQIQYPSITDGGGSLKLWGSTPDLGVLTGDASKYGQEACKKTGEPYAGLWPFEAELEVVS